MIKVDASTLAAYNEMVDKLEVIYPANLTVGPPTQYTITLALALWGNDARLLMSALDSQDINPWEVLFVEDGLSGDSPDQQNMVEFAARKKSWDCVAELLAHYHDCGMAAAIHAAVHKAMAEYETATDPERIAHLEAMMRASNLGSARHFAFRGDLDTVFHPAYGTTYPKSTRFAYKDFSSLSMSKKKGVGPIEKKRLDLRQKVFAAISIGDCAALGLALDMLKANAMACQTAKRVPKSALTTNEIQRFVAVALACDFPECVCTVLSKAVAFKKERSMVKTDGKKADDDQLKVLTHADSSQLLELIWYVAKAIDYQLHHAKLKPAASIEAAITKVLSSTLLEAGDAMFIEHVKGRSEESLTVMKACVELACAQVESTFEKQAIEASMPANSHPVVLPHERVRL